MSKLVDVSYLEKSGILNFFFYLYVDNQKFL